jgi:integrase
MAETREVQGKALASSGILGIKQLNNRESPELQAPPNGPHEITSAPLKCPECGSERLFKDGFRQLPTGEQIQRYRCADYGHRFSKHFPKQTLRLPQLHTSSSQVCVLERGTKNLDPTQETKLARRREGHTPTENEIKAAPQIEKLLIQLTNDGRKAGTVLNYRKSLTHLLKLGADLFDPENTKAALAKSPLKDSTKKTVAAILDVWFEFNEIKWKSPRYTDENEVPYIPTEQEIDLLIAALGQKTACFCQLLKETGARAGEIAELKWTSIDWAQRQVRIKAEKGSNSRILPLSPKAIEMLSKLSKVNRNPERKDRIFANADDMRTSFYLQKKRIVERQANPKLMLIHFHTFRHWKATTEQHKTKDPWHVKMILGHKSIKSTETYIHLEKMIYQESNDQFTVKVADALEDAVRLMEVGFEFHAEIEGHKLFRKRK